MSDWINTNIRRLFQNTIICKDCAKNNLAELFPNSTPEPRWIGKKYFLSSPRIMLILLNPGSGEGYKTYQQSINDHLEEYKSGNIDIEDYFLCQRREMKNWGYNEKFLNFYKSGLGLDFDSIALANIAWCATKNNKYVQKMLKNCFNRNTAELIRILLPKIVILSGTKTWNYKHAISDINYGIQFVKIWHYANRKSLYDNSLHIEEMKTKLKTVIKNVA